MYMELTPQDTVRDLQRLLLNALPEFEFPRKNLYNYTIQTETVNESDITPEDFVLGVVWQELPEDIETPVQVIIDNSVFNSVLTPEEMNILAILMMIGWVQRQVTSIEHTRMKYSGSNLALLFGNKHYLTQKKTGTLKWESERKL